MTGQRMRIAVALVAAGGLLALAAVSCAGKSAVGVNGDGNNFVSADGSINVVAAAKRVPAPPLRGMTLGGTSYDVASDLGHVVVVNFWGSWCAPCRAEQAKLNAAYAATRSRGVRFVGIDVHEDNDDAARAFLRTHAVSYPSIIDRNDQLALDFSPRLPDSPPTTVVLDRQGRVAARILGSAPSGVLEPLVDQVLGEAGAST